MVVGLDREQCGVKAKLSPKASLTLDCACALDKVQSPAASCQAASQAHLGDQGKDPQPWGGRGCIQSLTTTHQRSKSPLPEKRTVKSFQKATQSCGGRLLVPAACLQRLVAFPKQQRQSTLVPVILPLVPQAPTAESCLHLLFDGVYSVSFAISVATGSEPHSPSKAIPVGAQMLLGPGADTVHAGNPVEAALALDTPGLQDPPLMWWHCWGLCELPQLVAGPWGSPGHHRQVPMGETSP